MSKKCLCLYVQEEGGGGGKKSIQFTRYSWTDFISHISTIKVA